MRAQLHLFLVTFLSVSFFTRSSVEVQANDMLETGIQGAPFELPPLVRRTILKKRSAVVAGLAERTDGDDDHSDDDNHSDNGVVDIMTLYARRAELESQMDKKVLLGSKKGISTIRSRYARNFADASDDPTQFDGWVRPELEEDDSSDDDVENENPTPAVGHAQPAPRTVSFDRVFCPVLQASGVPCVANYKHGHGKSMEKHVLSHCPDGRAAEGALLWAQFVRDGKVHCCVSILDVWDMYNDAVFIFRISTWLDNPSRLPCPCPCRGHLCCRTSQVKY